MSEAESLSCGALHRNPEQPAPNQSRPQSALDLLSGQPLPHIALRKSWPARRHLAGLPLSQAQPRPEGITFEGITRHSIPMGWCLRPSQLLLTKYHGLGRGIIAPSSGGWKSEIKEMVERACLCFLYVSPYFQLLHFAHSHVKSYFLGKEEVFICLVKKPKMDIQHSPRDLASAGLFPFCFSMHKRPRSQPCFLCCLLPLPRAPPALIDLP